MIGTHLDKPTPLASAAPTNNFSSPHNGRPNTAPKQKRPARYPQEQQRQTPFRTCSEIAIRVPKSPKENRKQGNPLVTATLRPPSCFEDSTAPFTRTVRGFYV